MAEGGSDPPVKVTGADNCDVKNCACVGVNNGTINTYNYAGGVVDPAAIQRQTREDIKLWTKDKVETAALLTVLKKIQAGCSHVTITGSPGEGKSTLGFLVLRKLQETGQTVYKVTSHEQFDAVIKTPSSVVLLDDIFGQTVFNEAAWEEWRESLERFLIKKEQDPSNETGNLILIGRDFVFKSGARKSGNPWEMLTDSKYVVDISHGVVRDTQEKRKLVNSTAKTYKIYLDQRTVEEICRVNTPHGFPHTCKLFVTLYRKDRRISVVEFFHKPLEFLKKTLKIVIRDNVNRDIFMQMIKGDGCVSENNLSTDADKSYKYIEQANDLCGTYLKLDGKGNYVFDHPSILDTIAYLFCETNLSDILKHSSMEFINERVWLQTSDGKTRDVTESGVKLMATVPWSEAKKLARRFVAEIGAGNLVNVKYHNAWTYDEFVKLVIANVESAALNVDDRWPGVLHRLCWENRADCVKSCLQKGVDVNMKNSDGQTALHAAVGYGHIDVVHALCEVSGVDVNIKDQRGQTALHAAVGYGHIDVVHALCEVSGVDVNIKDQRGHTALRRAVDLRETYIVRELCKVNGVDLNIKDSAGQTALHRAAECGQTDIVRELCTINGADLNIKDSAGQTVLHRAAECGQTDIVRELCKVSGVDLNIKDSGSQTALHLSARGEHPETVRVLSEVSGVDVNITDSNGWTALHLAAVRGQTYIVSLLCKVSRVNVNITDSNGWTALHRAAVRGNTYIVSLLCKVSGVNVNIGDWMGRTVLHTAVENGHTDIVRVLCEVSGMDVNITDNEGQTALHKAEEGRKADIVHVLCGVSGLDVSITDGVV